MECPSLFSFSYCSIELSLQEKDIIFSIDERRVRGLSVPDIVQLLQSTSVKELRLEIWRGTEENRRTVKLETSEIHPTFFSSSKEAGIGLQFKVPSVIEERSA